MLSDEDWERIGGVIAIVFAILIWYDEGLTQATALVGGILTLLGIYAIPEVRIYLKIGGKDKRQEFTVRDSRLHNSPIAGRDVHIHPPEKPRSELVEGTGYWEMDEDTVLRSQELLDYSVPFAPPNVLVVEVTADDFVSVYVLTPSNFKKFQHGESSSKAWSSDSVKRTAFRFAPTEGDDYHLVVIKASDEPEDEEIDEDEEEVDEEDEDEDDISVTVRYRFEKLPNKRS